MCKNCTVSVQKGENNYQKGRKVKKVLTSGKKCAKINKSPRERANETKRGRKFLKSEFTKNSQRKVLTKLS